MTFISYAQNFEDVMLWRALRHIQNGCYIDIGANDPIVDSVSLAFYEHGWRGVHLEPTAQYANLLRQQRPDELVIQAAVSDSQKLLTFFEFPDTGLSTLDAAIAAEHQQKGFRVLQTVTPTLTLDDIFAQIPAPDIHWLKIDVEGAETSVLQGWQTSEVRPWIVVIESTLPMSQTPSHQQWESLLLAKGYQFVYFDGLNRYYVSDQHPELMAQSWLPPNVFDGFTIDGRASNVLSQDFQRRLQAAVENGQQSAAATVQDHEQAKQTLLNQLAQTRAQLELEATSAREEYQALSSQVRDARDELGQMVRLVSQREQEFANRFEHFQTDYQAVNQLLQQERDQASTQLQALQQQLQAQQQQYQAELQRHSELEDKLSALQLQLRQKEQAFAGQLLQLHQQKSGQQKVFQIREQSLRTELQRAREEIQRVGEQYQAELQDLRQTHETLRSESASWQQQYLQLQQESAGQMAQLAAALQQSENGAALQLQQHATELHQIIAELNSARGYIEQHQQQIAQLNTERDQLRNELSRVAKGYVELRADFKEKARRTTKFIQALHARHQFSLRESETKLTEVRSLVGMLNQQIEDKVQQLAVLEEHTNAQDSKSEETIAALASEIEFSRRALADYRNETAEKLKSSESLIKQLEQQLVDIKNSVTQAEVLNHELNKVIKEKESEIEISLAASLDREKTFSESVRQYDDKIALLESDIKSYQETLAQCKSMLSLFYAEIKRSRAGVLYKVSKLIHNLKLTKGKSDGSALSGNYHSSYYQLDTKLTEQDVSNYLEVNMSNENNDSVQKSINDIIGLPARDFVDLMYVLLLGRDADEVGRNYYVNKVLSGFSRTKIIYGLTKSVEWKENGKSVAGLDEIIREEKIKSIPVFGRLLSNLFCWQTNSAAEVQVRILGNKIDDLSLGVAKDMKSLKKGIEEDLKSFEKRLCELSLKKSQLDTSIEDTSIIIVDNELSEVWSPSNLNYSKETIDRYDELLGLVGVEGLKL